MISTTRYGAKRQSVRRKRECPNCELKKFPEDFRLSNRNPRLSLICWQCRKDEPGIESRFLGMNRRRIDSPSRKRIWAIVRLLRKRKLKKEVNGLNEIKKQAIALRKLPERIAAIIGKTYQVCGDDYKLSDDEALQMIRDRLDEVDSTLIERNKNKRLSRIS